jgi:hypothetical protein
MYLLDIPGSKIISDELCYIHYLSSQISILN